MSSNKKTANNKKKKQNKGPSVFSLAFGRMFGLGNREKVDIFTEEQTRSPMRSIVHSFATNPWAMIGLTIFLFFFIFCNIYAAMYPLDLNAQDVTQQNMPPSYKMMNVPKQLKNNAKQISVGGGFGIGIDNEGNLYQWGNLSDKMLKIPKNMGRVVQVSAGLDHALALNENGEVFTWGNNRMGLNPIPVDVQMAKNIKQLEAGYQYSMVVTEEGNLYFWGNQNIVNVSTSAYNGQTEKVVGNTSTAFVLTKTKEVAALTKVESPFTRIPEHIQGKVVDIAATDVTVAALLEDGTVVVWGQPSVPSFEVPEHIQGEVKEIYAGRGYFTAILEDGSIAGWGDNSYGQVSVPGNKDIKTLASGYHQNYAITNEGDVIAWGLKGYMMGTDHLGRDIFSRLVSGGRLTMIIGAISVIISSFIGIAVGGFAGYYGGVLDNILMRFAEIVNAIPFLPLAIILSSIMANKVSQTGRVGMIMVLLGILSWPSLARIVRAQILAEREKEFVTAAKAMGVRELGIIFRHILPNVITVILVNLTLSFATSMITESTLSWLGFGVAEPNATWGNMLTATQNSKVIGEYWWRWAFPAGALGLCSISINLIGDGLREAIDPKSQER